MTSEHEIHHPSAGRPVNLTPMPPGLWLVLAGGIVASLGPLFGFLLGSVLGSTTDTGDLEPIFLFLLLGMVVGGIGVAILLVGARRLIAYRREVQIEDEDLTDTPAPPPSR